MKELTPLIGTRPACRALGIAPATIYRWRRPPARRGPKPPFIPNRALSEDERAVVLTELHSERFLDASPAEVYATLLDEGRYLCSQRTMYRLLDTQGEVKERRNQLTHPAYAKPELLALGPNETWSWDITKLLGPAKWTYFYLYMILDVFSRYAVGWALAHRESAELAKRLIHWTVRRQKVPPGQLTLHADRGSAMTSKPVAFLLADLSVTKTHSRPHVSNVSAHLKARKSGQEPTAGGSRFSRRRGPRLAMRAAR